MADEGGAAGRDEAGWLGWVGMGSGQYIPTPRRDRARRRRGEEGGAKVLSVSGQWAGAGAGMRRRGPELEAGAGFGRQRVWLFQGRRVCLVLRTGWSAPRGWTAATVS